MSALIKNFLKFLIAGYWVIPSYLVQHGLQELTVPLNATVLPMGARAGTGTLDGMVLAEFFETHAGEFTCTINHNLGRGTCPTKPVLIKQFEE